jgi:UDP-glucose 6-dehydrogenase
VVIKSTIVPGTTVKLQQQYPELFVMHSPEFLRAKTAAQDAAKPERNIIGIPVDNPEFRQRAQTVLNALPAAPHNMVVSSATAECIKYIGNTFLYTKTVFMNMAYEFVRAAGGDWEAARQAVINDSRIGPSHSQIFSDDGRGAGGPCFIKDYEAFVQFYKTMVEDPEGLAALTSYRDKNNQLLISTQKDLRLLKAVYGQASKSRTKKV